MATKDDNKIDGSGIRISDGVQLEGEALLPHNHRLRAEALAAKGRKSDPDGMISDELIADAADRVSRENAAESSAQADAKAATRTPTAARSTARKPAARKPAAKPTAPADTKPTPPPADTGAATTEEPS